MCKTHYSPFLPSPPPQTCPMRGGEVMYGPCPDRTDQQSRWTERQKDRDALQQTEQKAYEHAVR